jgi:hypothetical protein
MRQTVWQRHLSGANTMLIFSQNLARLLVYSDNTASSSLAFKHSNVPQVKQVRLI